MTDNKKKKKSNSVIIKELRQRVKAWRDAYQFYVENVRVLEKKIQEIKKIFPTKYFLISYSAETQDGYTVKKEEIIEEFSVPLALESIKRNLIKRNSFKLLDIQIRC